MGDGIWQNMRLELCRMRLGLAKRYDKYELWKYACICVDDTCLEGIIERGRPFS